MISALILVLITIFRTSQTHQVARYSLRRIQKLKLTYVDQQCHP
jgi:hypothetical protein